MTEIMALKQRPKHSVSNALTSAIDDNFRTGPHARPHPRKVAGRFRFRDVNYPLAHGPIIPSFLVVGFQPLAFRLPPAFLSNRNSSAGNAHSSDAGNVVLQNVSPAVGQCEVCSRFRRDRIPLTRAQLLQLTTSLAQRDRYLILLLKECCIPRRREVHHQLRG